MIKIEDVDSTLKKDLKKTRGEVDKVLTQVIIRYSRPKLYWSTKLLNDYGAHFYGNSTSKNLKKTINTII